MLELGKGIQLANRYTLDRRLGGDTEAQIWLARDRLTASAVALKIVRGDEAASERLRDEWRTSIRLMHAHILRVFEFHAEPGLAFYSQQFVDGPNIAATIGTSLANILAPVGLIADALRYLHGKDLVHRDLKASNVLLDRNGAPYLSDFGVSAASGVQASGGSPIARSPQSIDGEPVSAADDIFAFAGLIYELISGRSPWSHDTSDQSIREHEPLPLNAVSGEEIPAAISDLLSRMLHKEAAARPDAEAVAAALQDAGFAPGTAEIEAAPRARGISDEVIETASTIRPVSRGQDETVEVISPASSGISVRTMSVSLLVLVSILIVVVVVLPDRVAEKTGVTPAATSHDVEAEAALVADETAEAGEVVERRRRETSIAAPTRTLDDEQIEFNENQADYSGLDEEGQQRFQAESAVGELLSALTVLEGRAVERWAPVEYAKARKIYADGDAAYLNREFVRAENLYLDSLDVIEPLYERIQPTFEAALSAAKQAFEDGDRQESLAQFELAVAITPNDGEALAGLERARNLEAVLRLMEQGIEYEDDLELPAAQRSYEQALQLDPLWGPAADGVARVEAIRTEMEFDLRMSEGFDALAGADYLAARAAFRMAQQLLPASTEPADGLLQVDQGLRLGNIQLLEQEAVALERDEHWDAVAETYEEILKVDNTLSFAIDGLARSREMGALHEQLDKYITEPDKLSAPSVMQRATTLVVNVTTRADVGPRLANQRDELSRLLKRAATPLSVALVSDNVTDVSIYKVGRLGNFMRTEVNLRPGTYVAIGVRPGYRDVRLEFRVAPENEMEPVVVSCEERI
ncbi:MAG: protein kinase [Gammaproteobacteria bacterium]|nr:protein kinase [Gammaproteobacteria bacterium]